MTFTWVSPPNDGADKCAADDPATDAARANPDDGPHGNANSRPNADTFDATKHRPVSVIEGFGLALCPMISTSGAPPRGWSSIANHDQAVSPHTMLIAHEDFIIDDGTGT